MHTRRSFLTTTAVAPCLGGAATAIATDDPLALTRATVDLPRGRVPVSFIIDDSTCLVNMGRFCMPQFQAAWPNNPEYHRPWQSWPAEIPDAFLRSFGTWCYEHGVKGKFSIVPNPACVGWLDRELPGWSQTALQESLKLVRLLMTPHWDIHPEMITHTRVIDLKTGRPHADISPATMENSFPQHECSVDELTQYLAYALKVLRNCDLPCEGITTPGGFGNRMKDKLGLAVFEAVRDVFGAELPHYFKYISEGDKSVLPQLEHKRGLDTEQPSVTVNIPAGTGDWFGGWDGARECEGHKYATPDATAGRMVELIRRREPAIMFCHWAGLYNLGAETGFSQFQRIVRGLDDRFGAETLWMKISEIGRYWTARELTRLHLVGREVHLSAPFAAADFTLRLTGPRIQGIELHREGQHIEFIPTQSLRRDTWQAIPEGALVCFDSPRGASRLRVL